MMPRHYLFFLFLLSSLHFQAQNVCEGNLGENIFTAGDFGSGTSNLVLTNPNIAPGYNYITAPPPSDGSYVITNNTGGWSNIYSSWMTIPDNSSDPNGYMMVVNANYDPGLFYDQTVDGLCENTLYEFSADIINIVKVGVPDHGLPNVSFLLDNVVSFTTGPVAQDGQWHDYGFTFTTAPGQSSIQLSLRNNAPGGWGNDLALDNISFRPCGPEALILPEIIANICEDGNPITLEATVNGGQYTDPAFQWQESFDGGLTWVNIVGANGLSHEHANLPSGFYHYRYLLANGSGNLQNSKCRVVSNVKVVQVVPKFYDFKDTICDGLFFSLGDNLLDTDGIYVDTFISSLGCDSIVTLDLTIQADPNIQASFTATTLSCHDSADGKIRLNNILNGNLPYRIFLNEVLQSNDTLFDNLSTGNYSFQILDRHDCSFEEDISITAPPPFQVEIGDDLQLALGESANISVQSNYPIDIYNWLPAGLVDCSTDCSAFTLFPIEDTNLQLNAISINGCLAEADLRINILEKRLVYLPNAFSPNGDGTNDYFTVFASTPNVQSIERLSVFDRWGNLVFERKNFPPNVSKLGWDGRFKNKQLNNGLYTYFTEVRFLDQQVKVYAGEINLLNH